MLPEKTGDKCKSTGDKRIALAIPDLRGGGGERSTLGIARGLLARGYTVDLVLFEDSNAYPDETPPEARQFVLRSPRAQRFRERIRSIPGLGIRRVLLLFIRLIDLAGNIRFIATYMRRERPDVLFPALGEAKVSTLLACFFVSSRPIVIPVMRNVVMNRSVPLRILYRLLFPSADRVVAISNGVADSLVEKLGIRREKIETIYNPVTRPEICAMASESPDHPWISEDGPPVFLAVGRLVAAKDFMTLLRAFHRVSSSRPARLIILGEGPWRNRLERFVKDMGMTEQVSLPGWAPNPFAYMSRASVFVVSSKYEGLSLVLIEALACGCPVVSTDCPSGPAEILCNGEFGPLVPVGDDAALAAAMEHLLDNPPESTVLRARAQDFSAESCAERYDRLIRKCLRDSASEKIAATAGT